MSTYAWVDFCAVIVPFLFSFHPRLRFHSRWRGFFAGAAVMMALFLPWDALFTLHGVWGFDPQHVWELRIFALPVEEWLFFLCVPYACLFSYHCLRTLGMKDPRADLSRWLAAFLIILLTAIAIVHRDRAYTFTAFSGCALWIAFTALVQRAPWFGRFLLTYAIMLLPFLVVNGILTGTGLDRPVVWYNNAENLGLRILTIPVEDVFYGMLMLGLVTTVYEAIEGDPRSMVDVRG